MRSDVDVLRRTVLCGIAAAALPARAQPSAGAGPAAALQGRWRSLETSKGGIGSMLQFGADGVLDQGPGAVVEMPYRIEGDQLVLPPATTSGPELRETITWLDADRVRFRTSVDADPGAEFTRSGLRQSAADPIIGEWVGSRQMAGRQLKVTRLFRQGGRLLLLIPFVSRRGSYSVIDRQLTLALPGEPMRTFAFDVAGNVLTLTTADAQESSYERY